MRMGSSSHMQSVHRADIKGKGICYNEEDDDAPIKLVDRDDSYVIKEAGLTLIGKILNQKKQNVEKLLQTMPSQWGMAERITANDLGNGKFLLNFTTEDDLKYALRQGPFHFNFCMFVLVRWEPIVHDDYPWIIPFWVRLVGFPLHTTRSISISSTVKTLPYRFCSENTYAMTAAAMPPPSPVRVLRLHLRGVFFSASSARDRRCRLCS
ncbi:DUF4283 domain-containing protein [Raphanus sativus]|nr:DUF4283 domain-containing protein [Raphanus sativus]